MIATIIIFIVSTILSVIIHYECLKIASKIKLNQYNSIILTVIIALIAHLIEIAIFALCYVFMLKNNLGSLVGNISSVDIADSLYFSITTFSTLGYGDVNPIGYIRFIAGIESLVGFVLITWTASFIYYEMQKSWDKQ